LIERLEGKNGVGNVAMKRRKEHCLAHQWDEREPHTVVHTYIQLLGRLRQEDCLSPGAQGQPWQLAETLGGLLNSYFQVRCQWLMPIILATW
jgi:hypothetical protein